MIYTRSLDLLDFIYNNRFDAIVVEGYDGVGKGRILDMISSTLSVTPYRPDYEFWQKYGLRPQDRWKISGFFWEIYNHFHLDSMGTPLLFDRGILSGAVYNNDPNIAKDYKSLLKGRRVLHILVDCDIESYVKFCKVRNPNITEEDISLECQKFVEYQRRYKEYLKLSKIIYCVYMNTYDKDIADTLASTCEGCGHYSYGRCRHPNNHGFRVNPLQTRCSLTYDKEVQDIIDTTL